MRLTDQVFVTSDHHFGHQNMVNWGYREQGWEESAVTEWNSVVRKEDIVLHLGDLALCPAKTALNWLQRLNGRKYLVLGNHDRFSESVYTNFGFIVIPPPLFEYKIAKPKEIDKEQEYIFKNILFTHRPFPNLPKDWWNYHGHTHGNHHRQIIGITDHHIDCGVDVWGLKPKKIREIYSYMELQQSKSSGEQVKL